MYTALFLYPESTQLILDKFSRIVPDGWKKYAHHMTINLGSAKNRELLGKEFMVKIVSIAMDDKVIALGVENTVSTTKANGSWYSKGLNKIIKEEITLVSDNVIKHITLAVNEKNGGKPKHSNELKEWTTVEPLIVIGVVGESQ